MYWNLVSFASKSCLVSLMLHPKLWALSLVNNFSYRTMIMIVKHWYTVKANVLASAASSLYTSNFIVEKNWIMHKRKVLDSLQTEHILSNLSMQEHCILQPRGPQASEVTFQFCRDLFDNLSLLWGNILLPSTPAHW